MNVGENIRRIREEKKMRQAELADLTGVTQAMICQVERDIKKPSLPLAKQIALALDCSLDELAK